MMHRVWSHGMAVTLVLALGGGCSQASDSTVYGKSDGGSSGGSSSGGGGGSSGGGGGSSGGGGGDLDAYVPPQGDSGVLADDGGSTCAAQASMTMGVHIKLNVSWAGTLVLTAGSGIADIWLLATSTTSGTKFTGTARTCGITLPDITLTMLAGSAGGKKIHLGFPDMWDVRSMPTFPFTGMLGGWNVGDAYNADPAMGCLGLAKTSSYASASATWPGTTSFPQFQKSELTDDDGDSNPGIALNPSKVNDGYTLVPTSLDTGDTADALSIVSRNVIGMKGKWTSCVEARGDAQVSLFDNHVVWCQDAAGTAHINCDKTTGTAVGPGFVDANRTLFKPGTATFVSRRMVDGATCAQVRAAVP